MGVPTRALTTVASTVVGAGLVAGLSAAPADAATSYYLGRAKTKTLCVCHTGKPKYAGTASGVTYSTPKKYKAKVIKDFYDGSYREEVVIRHFYFKKATRKKYCDGNGYIYLYSYGVSSSKYYRDQTQIWWNYGGSRQLGYNKWTGFKAGWGGKTP
ncbi:hypothetical protein [Actinomadura parmotrematis]|uniref:Uncharacterized protein n=1 Tax=Actinomadura parmotrematis TaxID=2864039 RepID=A0ABS7G2R6_9ACTN|nr:hypothetical protein [Actinomadura parmotrematis]MBW8486977.1 hypothetical protein [Actinomadura parmotrematis]